MPSREFIIFMWKYSNLNKEILNFNQKLLYEHNFAYSDYEKIDETKVEKAKFHKNEVLDTK